MGIEIHNLQSLVDIDLGLVCRAIAKSSGEDDPDVNVSIVDDDNIRRINLKHLGRDNPTDVIAFDYNEREDGQDLSGEVIVSAETALRVSVENSINATAELILYIVHGVLHLRGFDDKDPEDASRMWDEQKLIMKSLGFSNDFEF